MKKIQLFFLPFAGGSSVSFEKLFSLLESSIDIIPIEYAGRMSRRKEGYITEYDAFLNDVAFQINMKRIPGVPYAVLGYSLGSVLLYDLLSRKLIEGLPSYAFVCAKDIIQDKTEIQDYSGVEEDEFTREIVELGGIDKRILHNERFWKIYMQPIKADFSIWEKFVFKPGCIPCSASIIYSTADSSPKRILDWSELIDGKAEFYEIGDNHFFVFQHLEDVADIINYQLIMVLAAKNEIT